MKCHKTIMATVLVSVCSVAIAAAADADAKARADAEKRRIQEEQARQKFVEQSKSKGAKGSYVPSSAVVTDASYEDARGATMLYGTSVSQGYVSDPGAVSPTALEADMRGAEHLLGTSVSGDAGQEKEKVKANVMTPEEANAELRQSQEAARQRQAAGRGAGGIDVRERQAALGEAEAKRRILTQIREQEY